MSNPRLSEDEQKIEDQKKIEADKKAKIEADKKAKADKKAEGSAKKNAKISEGEGDNAGTGGLTTTDVLKQGTGYTPEMLQVQGDPNLKGISKEDIDAIKDIKDKQAEEVKARSKKNIDQVAISDEKRVKSELSAQPKVRFAIPLFPGERAGAIKVVQINGVKFEYKKGQMYDMPEAVAQLLADSYNIQLSIGRDSEIGRADDVQSALG